MSEQPTTWERMKAEDAAEYHRDRSYEISYDVVKMAFAIAGAGIIGVFAFLSSAASPMITEGNPPIGAFKEAAKMAVSTLEGFLMAGVVAFAAYLVNLLAQIGEWKRASKFVRNFDPLNPKEFKDGKGSIIYVNFLFGGLGVAAGMAMIMGLVRAIVIMSK